MRNSQLRSRIKSIVANGNGRVRLLVVVSGYDAEGDIVNGEVRLRINVHPGFERRHWKAPSMGRQSGGGGVVFNELELLSAAYPAVFGEQNCRC